MIISLQNFWTVQNFTTVNQYPNLKVKHCGLFFISVAEKAAVLPEDEPCGHKRLY